MNCFHGPRRHPNQNRGKTPRQRAHPLRRLRHVRSLLPTWPGLLKDLLSQAFDKDPAGAAEVAQMIEEKQYLNAPGPFNTKPATPGASTPAISSKATATTLRSSKLWPASTPPSKDSPSP